MNLVELVRNFLSNELMTKLGSVIGGGEGPTRSAISAAIPAILAALAKMMTTGSGPQKLASAMNEFDADSEAKLASMFSGGQATQVADKGNNLLDSFFGNSQTNDMTNAVSRFAGLPQGTVKNLFAYLLPMILGVIAKRFAGKGVTPQGLTTFFNEETNNITRAMPSGFSMNDVPGFGTTVPSTNGMAQEPASNLRWLVPVAGVAALAAFVLWYAFGNPNTNSPPVNVPSAAQLTTDVGGAVKSLGDSLTSVKDAATANAALPKFEELDRNLEKIQGQLAKLQPAERTKIVEQLKGNLNRYQEQFSNVLMTPGVAVDKVRPVVEKLAGRIGEITGSTVALPSVEATKLGGDLSTTFTTLTETLAGIKDVPTAEAALPRLKELDGKIDAAKRTFESLQGNARTAIVTMVRSAVAKLKEAVTGVMAIRGVGDKVKPALDAIVNKLESLVA